MRRPTTGAPLHARRRAAAGVAARALAGHTPDPVGQLAGCRPAGGAGSDEQGTPAGAVTVEAHTLITMATVMFGQGDEAATLASLEDRLHSSSSTGKTTTSPACRTIGCTTSSPWAASRRPPTATQDRAAMRRSAGTVELLATSATSNESEVLVDLGRFDHARVILDDAVGLIQPDWWHTSGAPGAGLVELGDQRPRRGRGGPRRDPTAGAGAGGGSDTVHTPGRSPPSR